MPRLMILQILCKILCAWLLRWLEVWGRYPSPVRDHGLCTWQYLRGRAAGPVRGAGARVLCDEPHLPIGMTS